MSALVQVVLPEPVGPETKMFLRREHRQAHEGFVLLRLQEPQEFGFRLIQGLTRAARGAKDPARA